MHPPHTTSEHFLNTLAPFSPPSILQHNLSSRCPFFRMTPVTQKIQHSPTQGIKETTLLVSLYWGKAKASQAWANSVTLSGVANVMNASRYRRTNCHVKSSQASWQRLMLPWGPCSWKDVGYWLAFTPDFSMHIQCNPIVPKLGSADGFSLQLIFWTCQSTQESFCCRVWQHLIILFPRLCPEVPDPTFHPSIMNYHIIIVFINYNINYNFWATLAFSSTTVSWWRCCSNSLADTFLCSCRCTFHSPLPVEEPKATDLPNSCMFYSAAVGKLQQGAWARDVKDHHKADAGLGCCIFLRKRKEAVFMIEGSWL